MHAALEVGDELLALPHQAALRDGAGLEPTLHRLHERDVLLGDLVVPGQELLHLAL